MTHYIETKTKNGSVLKIEVEDTSKPSTGFARATQPTNVSTEAAQSAYNDLLQAIEACAAGVVDTIQNMSATPSAASVDFAVKIDGEVGVMIARSREDAQFRVSLSWKQPEPDKPDGDK
ncbi:MAG: hypothetical protein Kow0031_03640 [Anaerolineae bacterium]